MIKLFLLGTTLSLIAASPAFCMDLASMDEGPKDAKKHTRKKPFFRTKSFSDVGTPQLIKSHKKSASLGNDGSTQNDSEKMPLTKRHKKSASLGSNDRTQKDLEERPQSTSEKKQIQRSKGHHRTTSSSVPIQRGQKDLKTLKNQAELQPIREKVKQKSKSHREKRSSIQDGSGQKAPTKIGEVKDPQEMIDDLKTADELDREANQLFIQNRTQETHLREKELAKGSLQEQQEVDDSKTADELDKEAHQLLSQNRARAKLLKEKALAKRSSQQQQAVDNSKTGDELYEEARFCNSINKMERGFELMQEASKKGSEEAKKTLEAIGL